MSHSVLFRVDAASPRLGRAFRTAPVSRQTNPNPVWHSPRFHSRPATLLRPPFCPFHRSALFLPAAAQVKKKQAGNGRKGKNMKLEEVNTRTKEAVDFLVAALESGHSEVLTAYLGAMAKFHTYSFGNIMLIARQKPDATNVAGLRTWNSLGRFVKRGEKGIFILAPMVGRRSTKDVATDEPSEDATTEGQRTLYGFRAVYVFDVSQTEGKELPTLTEVHGDVSGYRERLFKFVESSMSLVCSAGGCFPVSNGPCSDAPHGDSRGRLGGGSCGLRSTVSW